MAFNMKLFAFLMSLFLLVPLFFTTSQGRPTRTKTITTRVGGAPTQQQVLSKSHAQISIGSYPVRNLTTEKDFRPTTPGHSPGAGH